MKSEPIREPWRADTQEIGFDLGIAAESIMIAAGIQVFCDEDPFRIDCMRAVFRRLKAMAARKLEGPTIEERREAVDELQKLVDELRATVARNTKPIDAAKATEIAREEIARQEEFGQ